MSLGEFATRLTRTVDGRLCVLFGAGAVGVVITGLGIAAALSDDEQTRRGGELVLSAGIATQPGLHNFIAIAFALVFNAFVIAMAVWTLLMLVFWAIRVFARENRASYDREEA